MTAPERAADWSMATGYVGISPAAYDTPKLRPTPRSSRRPWSRRRQFQYATPELSTFQTAAGCARLLRTNAIRVWRRHRPEARRPTALKAAQGGAEKLLNALPLIPR